MKDMRLKHVFCIKHNKDATEDLLKRIVNFWLVFIVQFDLKLQIKHIIWTISSNQNVNCHSQVFAKDKTAATTRFSSR